MAMAATPLLRGRQQELHALSVCRVLTAKIVGQLAASNNQVSMA
jgi:hypothetical protein